MDRRRDVATLFAMRGLRLFAYGALAVVIALYLVEIGLDPGQVGLLLALTLAGDAVISLLLTTHADRIGRRTTLVIGAALMVLYALGFGLATVAVALAIVLDTWLALLLVTVGLLLLAVVLGLLARSRLRRGTPPLPEQAIREAKLTTQALKANGDH